MNPVKLSIIIVNYNVTEEIIACISSIKNTIKNVSYEIIVVDNNSVEKKAKELPSIFKDIRVIYLEDNIGYGPANNVGAGAAKGEYILILNPDMIFCEDCITPLIDYLRMHPEAGASTPMLVYENGKFQYSFGFRRSLTVELLDAFYIFNSVYEKVTLKKINGYISKKTPFETGWISGAFMLMRRADFNTVSGFSPEYKLNYEDMDLCLKLQKTGYKIIYFPENRCIHHESISQRKSLYNYIYYRYKGRLLFSKKNYGFFSYFLIRAFHIFGLLLRIMFSFALFPADERKERNRAFKDSLKLYLGFS
jgi:GT2 family glycosyltransferase